MNCALVRSASKRASVVLPVPGGPQRMSDEIEAPCLRALPRIDVSPMTPAWPTNSPRLRGRIRSANGASGLGGTASSGSSNNRPIVSRAIRVTPKTFRGGRGPPMAWVAAHHRPRLRRVISGSAMTGPAPIQKRLYQTRFKSGAMTAKGGGQSPAAAFSFPGGLWYTARHVASRPVQRCITKNSVGRTEE